MFKMRGVATKDMTRTTLWEAPFSRLQQFEHYFLVAVYEFRWKWDETYSFFKADLMVIVSPRDPRDNEINAMCMCSKVFPYLKNTRLRILVLLKG